MATILNEEKKMTREEAVKTIKEVCYYSGTSKTGNTFLANNIVDALTALGLLKFDEGEERKNDIEIIIELINNSIEHGNVRWNKLGVIGRIVDAYGTIRLEEWPEGLVLWVGGKIVYKSWEKKQRENNLVYGADKPKANETADNTNYVKHAKEYIRNRPTETWGSASHIIQGLLNIIEGHVKPNVDNWTVSKGDIIHVTFRGWNGNNPQYDGEVIRIEKSPGS